jgi:hypothetical protein
VAKAKLAGVMLTAGTAPVPVSWTVWGEAAALSVKINWAESAPAAVGLKVTVMVQDKPALIVPQVLF